MLSTRLPVSSLFGAEKKKVLKQGLDKLARLSLKPLCSSGTAQMYDPLTSASIEAGITGLCYQDRQHFFLYTKKRRPKEDQPLAQLEFTKHVNLHLTNSKIQKQLFHCAEIGGYKRQH